jgi:hypothetical protein
VLGDAVASLEHAQASAAAFEATGDIRGRLLATPFVGGALTALGMYDEAAALMTSTVAEAERLGHRYAAWSVRTVMAPALAATGAVLDAMQHLLIARDGFAAGGNRVQAALTRALIAAFMGRAGDVEGAEREIAGVLEDLPERSPFRLDAFLIRAHLRLRAGDARGALQHTSDAIALIDALGSGAFVEPSICQSHAEGLRAVGDEAGALAAAERARAALLARAARIADRAMRERYLAMRTHARILRG